MSFFFVFEPAWQFCFGRCGEVQVWGAPLCRKERGRRLRVSLHQQGCAGLVATAPFVSEERQIILSISGDIDPGGAFTRSPEKD